MTDELDLDAALTGNSIVRMTDTLGPPIERLLRTLRGSLFNIDLARATPEEREQVNRLRAMLVAVNTPIRARLNALDQHVLIALDSLGADQLPLPDGRVLQGHHARRGLHRRHPGAPARSARARRSGRRHEGRGGRGAQDRRHLLGQQHQAELSAQASRLKGGGCHRQAPHAQRARPAPPARGVAGRIEPSPVSAAPPPASATGRRHAARGSST